MDRLHVVIAVAGAVALGACDDRPTASPPTPTASRVNAVVATKKKAEAPEDFCDVFHANATDAVIFTYPELSAEDDVPAPAKGWSWVNIWATWCEPCIEEMPRLAQWKAELAENGLGDVVFVSADDSEEVVAKFRAQHPDAPDSVRLSTPDALQPWVNELGLAGSPSLPIHIFVDGDSKARCIRMGGVTDQDRDAVERVLGS